MSEITERLTTALADRYKIERRLGEGGMATVYLAEDIKHDRKVALKILRPELAAVLGAERFVQEIKTTANLQHPHILPLFDSGEADSFLYYVMPYVEGETLRDKLNRETQLGIEEAVKIAAEIADALDYAHRNNVIHRDIKPENILLHDGRPMVADFGIALAVSAAAGGRMTETGLSLGTPHYMSPEQATAEKEITPRSDVYSLASVLYEMLTGEPPHMGNSAQAIIMKIVTEDAQPVTRLRKSVPHNVTAAVAKALERLPADRFDTAKTFADALGNPSFTAGTTVAGTPHVARGGPRAFVWPAIAGLAAVIALIGWFRPAPPEPSTTRQWIGLSPRRAGGTLQQGWPFNLAIAADGSAIAFGDSVGERGGEQQIFVKERTSPAAMPLSGTVGGSQPFFSPDGRWIGFATDAGLWKIPRGGGPPVLLSDSGAGFTAGAVAAGAWLEDGTVVFVARGGTKLLQVDEQGGPVREVLAEGRLPPGALIRLAALPSGQGVVITVCTVFPCTQGEAWAVDLVRDSLVRLLVGVSAAWYVPSGHLLYGRPDGSLFVQQLDRERLALADVAIPVMTSVATIGGVPAVEISAAGTALLSLGGTDMMQDFATDLVLVDRAGSLQIVDSALQLASLGFGGVSLSPDGRRVALVQIVDQVPQIFVKQLPDGPVSRLTFEGGNFRPVWSPDGRDILHIHNDSSYVAHRRRSDGTGTPVVVVAEERPVQEVLLSPDQQWIVYRTDNAAAGRGDILARRISGDTTTVALIATNFEEAAPALSPDGRWLAYASDEGGQREVFVRPFPDVESGKWQVSREGGSEPQWAGNGRELFYRSANQDFTVATVETSPAFRVTATRVLFSAAAYLSDPVHPMYAVSPDGQSFVFSRVDFSQQIDASRLILVENWFTELRALLEQN